MALTLTARPSPAALYRTAAGKKIVMAATGAVMVLFLVAHVLGNLKFFLGPAATDGYARWLRRLGEPVLPYGWYLWIQRGVLAACAVAHVVAAIQLSRRARAARPVGYTGRRRLRDGRRQAAVMRWGGLAVGLFVTYHLLDLSAGLLHPHYRRGAVYHNVVGDFRLWYVAAAYLLAVAALGLHLHHGVWSLFQTLGWAGASSGRALRLVSAATALALTAGFAAVPIAVLAGAGS